MNQQIKNRIIRNLEYLNASNGSNLEEMNDRLILTKVDLKRIKAEKYFPLESLVLISNHYKVSLDDIFKLDFFELKDKEKENIFYFHRVANEDDNFGMISIPFITIVAAGTSLNGTEPKNFPDLQLPKRLFPSYGINDYAAFEVEGNSMEPDVTHGSIIIGERIENLDDIKNGSGRRYVVVLQNEILFKRLFWTENHLDFETIRMVSDNVEHPEISVEASKIKELWKPYQIIARTT